MLDPVGLHHLGRIAYGPALAWQRRHEDAVRRGSGGEAVALLEHTPVYTLGARGNRSFLLASADELARRGALVVEADRGGDVTFHGPGQLVVYPVLNVRRRGLGAAEYVRTLERVVVDALAVFGVRGERVAGRPGVWTASSAGLAKIAAVGVRLRRGVSTHGLALNVDVDLAWFDAIVPCGIADAEVTTLARVLSAPPPMCAVEEAVAEAFERAFEVELHDRGPEFDIGAVTTGVRAGVA